MNKKLFIPLTAHVVISGKKQEQPIDSLCQLLHPQKKILFQ